MLSSQMIFRKHLAVLLLVFSFSCSKPQSQNSINPFYNLPPKTARLIASGEPVIWAMAFTNGLTKFYLSPPLGQKPKVLIPRMGMEQFDVKLDTFNGKPLYSWNIVLGAEVRSPVFSEPLFVDIQWPGQNKKQIIIMGLGKESYPFFNACFFDLTTETVEPK